MRATRSGAWLLVLVCMLSLVFLMGAADSATDTKAKDSKSSKDSKADKKEAKDTGSAVDKESDGKESLPLLAIPPAPIDEEADSDSAASADGVTASSSKLPPKEKKKAGKSGTIESKGDKARSSGSTEESAVSSDDDGEAIDVLVSSNVKAVKKKPSSKTRETAPAKPSGKPAAKPDSAEVRAEQKALAAGTTKSTPVSKPNTGNQTKKVAKPAASDKRAANGKAAGKNNPAPAASNKKQSAGTTATKKEGTSQPGPGKSAKAPESIAGYFEEESGIDAAEGSSVVDLDDTAAFDSAESAPSSDQTALDAQLMDQPIGVIDASRHAKTDASLPTGDSGKSAASELDKAIGAPGSTGSGNSLPKVNYLRTFSVLALLVGLLLLLGRGLRQLQGTGRLGSLLPGLASSTPSMKVVESIGLGPGKQIMIVELHGELLVLGSTPHSINLLDKLPADSQGEGYRSAVSRIIEREMTPAAELPRAKAVNSSFDSSAMTVAEMRRSRGGLSLAETPRGSVSGTVENSPRWSRGSASDAGESQLISRIREQLKELEED